MAQSLEPVFGEWLPGIEGEGVGLEQRVVEARASGADVLGEREQRDVGAVGDLFDDLAEEVADLFVSQSAYDVVVGQCEQSLAEGDP